MRYRLLSEDLVKCFTAQWAGGKRQRHTPTNS